MTELSTALGLAKSTTTGLVDGIERRGYAVREPAAEDSRALNVRLTDGRPLAASASPCLPMSQRCFGTCIDRATLATWRPPWVRTSATLYLPAASLP